jgi:hypothetical protein
MLFLTHISAVKKAPEWDEATGGRSHEMWRKREREEVGRKKGSMAT